MTLEPQTSLGKICSLQAFFLAIYLFKIFVRDTARTQNGWNNSLIIQNRGYVQEQPLSEAPTTKRVTGRVRH